MIWNGNHHCTWTCSFSSCYSYPYDYSLTVLSERASTDGLLPVADCTYGDTVMLQTSSSFSVAELAVIGTRGEIRCFIYVRYNVITALYCRIIMRFYGRQSLHDIDTAALNMFLKAWKHIVDIGKLSYRYSTFNSSNENSRAITINFGTLFYNLGPGKGLDLHSNIQQLITSSNYMTQHSIKVPRRTHLPDELNRPGKVTKIHGMLRYPTLLNHSRVPTTKIINF